MSSSTVKLVLNAAEFPFTYADTPRSAIVNSDVAPRMPASFYGDRSNADYSTAQVIYCENVMPYAKGIFSVNFNIQASAISPAFTKCDQVIQLRDSQERVYMLVPAQGANYLYNASAGTWASVSPFTFTGVLVTKAYVNGRTFVCYEKNRIIEYNPLTSLFTTIALTFPAGLAITDVRGIGGASNYLLLFTDFAVYWCSPLDLMDFSNIDAGAGQMTPIDIKGQITSILPVYGGFIVYTTRNAIGATFTNDAAAPFIFREVNNCGGCTSWELIAEAPGGAGHYLWGTNGLQRINLQEAESVFPEVTDFLVGKRIERWNSTTKKVEIVSSAAVMIVKLSFLAGRYLVISYSQGTTYFEFALIYDTILGRWGKVRVDHADAFMYPYPSGTGNYTYDTLPGVYSDLLMDYFTLSFLFLQVLPTKQGVAFLRNTGEVVLMTTDFAEVAGSGVALIGHLSTQHSKFCTVTEAVFDGLRTTPTPTVSVVSASDGRNRDIVTTMQLAADQSGEYSRYRSRVSAWNHDIAIEGNFVLSTGLASLVGHGYR